MFPLLWPLIGLGAVKTGFDINNANKQNAINQAEVRNRSFTHNNVDAKNSAADVAGPMMQAALMGGMVDAQNAHTAANPGGSYSPYTTPAQQMAAFSGGGGPVNIDNSYLWNPYRPQ